jgi:hypothetical protein
MIEAETLCNETMSFRLADKAHVNSESLCCLWPVDRAAQLIVNMNIGCSRVCNDLWLPIQVERAAPGQPNLPY